MFGADNINFKFIHLNLYVQFFQGKHEREEEERKRRIQLYVFISRCISYPFNAKQPTDMTKRQTKISKQQLEIITQRFQVRNKSIIMC